MTTIGRYCLVSLTALVLAGCAHVTPTESATRPAGARLTTNEAIEIAKHAAEHQGLRLSEYKAPEAHYEFTRKDKSWWVVFDGKIPIPGNHFAVSIDDQTGKAELIPGE
jgi:hypothetical protein